MRLFIQSSAAPIKILVLLNIYSACVYKLYQLVCMLKWVVVVVGWFGLVSLFNGISTFLGYFNAKAILLEEQQWYYLTHSWEDKGVYIFPKGICLKVNVIAQLEYELAYYNSAVHRFNHYTTRTPFPVIGIQHSCIQHAYTTYIYTVSATSYCGQLVQH